MIWLAGILFVTGGFSIGYITGLNYQIKKFKQTLNQLQKFIRDESDVEEKNKKEKEFQPGNWEPFGPGY
jgi:hypothetical protein